MKKTYPLILGLALLLGCTKEITLGTVEVDMEQSYCSNNGTALVVAHVTDDGGDLTDAGICYVQSNYGDPTFDNIKRSCGAVRDIRVELSGLAPGAYRLRAYVTNRAGTAFSQTVTFTIDAPSVPTVTLGNCTYNATAGTATLRGSVTSNGGATVTRAGFCYVKSASATPTLSNTVAPSSDLTNLVAELSNLSDGTYRVRAFATNSQGTAYSSSVATFTIDRNGGGGNTRTLNDFLGTWSCQATDWQDNSHSWYGTTITSLGNNEVLVEGLYFQSEGGQAGPYFYALGIYDATQQCIVLYGGYAFNDHSNYYYYWNSAPDTLLYAYYYPMYRNSNGSWSIVRSANGDLYDGEATLKFNSAGKLVYGPSNTPSSDGHYAEGYCFQENYYDTDELRGWWPGPVITSLTMTKTSSKAPAVMTAADGGPAAGIVHQRKKFSTTH